jgi:hypothetical protein
VVSFCSISVYHLCTFVPIERASRFATAQTFPPHPALAYVTQSSPLTPSFQGLASSLVDQYYTTFACFWLSCFLHYSSPHSPLTILSELSFVCKRSLPSHHLTHNHVSLHLQAHRLSHPRCSRPSPPRLAILCPSAQPRRRTSTTRLHFLLPPPPQLHESERRRQSRRVQRQQA